MAKRIVLVFLLILVAGLSVIFAPLLYDNRPLTKYETEFLRSIYGSSVDLDKIRIKSSGPLTWTDRGAVTGNIITLSPAQYSDETRKWDQSVLVHEVCHVWQYQHFGLGYIPGSLWEQLTDSDAYHVDHDPEKSFRDYGIEEQCMIAENYYYFHSERYEGYIKEIQTQGF